MPTQKEKKFDQNNSKKSTWSPQPVFVPVVVGSWKSNPEICFDGLSLDGDDGGGSDDDDNLAYTTILKSVKDLQEAEPSVSVFKFSQTFPGGVNASWRAMKVNSSLFVSISSSSSFNKECFVSLLDYAEEVLHCECVFVLLKKQDNHAYRPLLQSFRFMGFSVLPPSTPIVSSVSPLGYLVMSYRIDSSSGEDD